MSSAPTHKTALCLIPPENVWEQIQSIRSKHDKAYPRWMPHINLTYPFVPESKFADIKIQLDSILNQRHPFEIEFDQNSIQYFKQKNECTFHLRPKQSKDVVELQQIIQNCLPQSLSSSRAFEAHLTLGQTTTSRISDVLIEMKANWKPIKFILDRVSMISRENDPNDLFSIKNQVLLIGSMDEQQKNRDEDDDNLPMESLLSDSIPTPLTSSTFTLCIVPPHEFSSRLLHLFEDASFQPLKPFQIILAEYDQKPNEFELSSKLNQYQNFQLIFLHEQYVLIIQQHNKDFDGTLTLGHLDKKDLTDVCNRFTQGWDL